MILVLGLVLISSSAFAATVIRNSKHDLSSSGGQSVKSQTVDKLCEHCHAPHNARVAVPLWNRANPSGTFLLYTSSATLATGGAAKNASIGATSISAQCLSCHAARPGVQGDVTTVVRDNTLNAAIKASTFDAPATGLKNAGLGTDLTNDHPIGFSYATAITDRASVAGATPLQAQAFAEGKGMKFFTTGGNANQMECSSCHMVHNPSNGYFLRIANTGSAVCRACHQN